jgi:hypothetical protein
LGRVAITAEVNSLGPRIRNLSAAIAERDGLAGEIASLEAAEDASDSAINALATKRGKHELLVKRADRLSLDAAPQMENLRSLLTDANAPIRAAFSPVFDSFVEDIAGKLAPFYRDPRNAIALARGTDAAGEFGVFITRRFGVRDDSLSEANEALALIECMLGGEVSFQFQPGR